MEQIDTIIQRMQTTFLSHCVRCMVIWLAIFIAHSLCCSACTVTVLLCRTRGEKIFAVTNVKKWKCNTLSSVTSKIDRSKKSTCVRGLTVVAFLFLRINTIFTVIIVFPNGVVYWILMNHIHAFIYCLFFSSTVRNTSLRISSESLIVHANSTLRAHNLTEFLFSIEYKSFFLFSLLLLLLGFPAARKSFRNRRNNNE